MKVKITRYLIPSLILSIIITFGLFSCSSTEPKYTAEEWEQLQEKEEKTNEEVKKYLREFKYIKQEFIDEYNNMILSETSSSSISNLKNVRRDLIMLAVPEECDKCLDLKNLCLEGMNKIIDAFDTVRLLDKLGKEEDYPEAKQLFDKALENITEAKFKIFKDVDLLINDIEKSYK